MTTLRLAAALLAACLLLPCAAAQDPPTESPTDSPTDTPTDAPTPTAAPDACNQPGKNIQCTGFGSIAMDTQRDIKGDPVDLTASVWLNTNYADHGTRWILFSIRNVTSEGSPIAISLLKFATPSGEVVTTRVDHDKPNEVDLWVDILDTPVNTPITIDVQVGSSERGAYRLEALVLAFDRGYETVKVDGGEASLFASTLLGVNKETGKIANAGGGSILQGKKTPGLLVPGLVLALCAVALLRRRLA
ncbi:MAG: hypothetical protein QOI63_1033 [Thermoplasmata archaeon]|jgi:hypothetical protein|nr:hypothetical protein [Thermoplasmata archaeon]